MSENRQTDWIRANPVKAALIGSVLLMVVVLMDAFERGGWASVAAPFEAFGVIPALAMFLFIFLVAVGAAVSVLLLGIWVGLAIFGSGVERGHPRWGAALGAGFGVVIVAGGLALMKTLSPVVGAIVGDVMLRLFGEPA